MTFDYPGYDLIFIQAHPCRDGSKHLFTHIFTFYSPVTRYRYVVRAEYHQEDIFVVKFYPKPLRKSENKYRKITNRFDVGNILISCLKVVPKLLDKFPNASFGFIGATSIDKATNRIEGPRENQRYKIYAQIAAEKIGTVTFTHLRYPAISGYLLVNNNCGDVMTKESAIKEMFKSTYNEIPY